MHVKGISFVLVSFPAEPEPTPPRILETRRYKCVLRSPDALKNSVHTAHPSRLAAGGLAYGTCRLPEAGAPRTAPRDSQLPAGSTLALCCWLLPKAGSHAHLESSFPRPPPSLREAMVPSHVPVSTPGRRRPASAWGPPGPERDGCPVPLPWASLHGVDGYRNQVLGPGSQAQGQGRTARHRPRGPRRRLLAPPCPLALGAGSCPSLPISLPCSDTGDPWPSLPSPVLPAPPRGRRPVDQAALGTRGGPHAALPARADARLRHTYTRGGNDVSRVLHTSQK